MEGLTKPISVRRKIGACAAIPMHLNTRWHPMQPLPRSVACAIAGKQSRLSLCTADAQ
ncbi:hypothetical protein IG631_07852 [Alternaria alternata]|nr:hypothetical protein IG631_07852 [Alternaria alternata]